MPNTKTVGKKAEVAAKLFLQHQGLRFIEGNYYCRKGEIDLIMQDAQQLVFIEVKFRRNHYHGSGAEAVTHQKRLKIISAARHYLHQHHLTEIISCRFDVVSINPTSNSCSPFNIEWIQHAFDLH
jgi:putative endonuclease